MLGTLTIPAGVSLTNGTTSFTEDFDQNGTDGLTYATAPRRRRSRSQPVCAGQPDGAYCGGHWILGGDRGTLYRAV